MKLRPPLAYESPNSLLAETGWRMKWVTDESGQEKLLYFSLTEDDFLHPQEDDHLPSNTFHGTAQRDLLDILQRRYAEREDVGIFGDLIVKWGIKNLRQNCPIEVVSPRYRRAD